MNMAEIVWGLIIVFCLGSFTWMSIKILIRGLPELRDMFNALEEEKKRAADS
jgi:hypothetical protein